MNDKKRKLPNHEKDVRTTKLKEDLRVVNKNNVYHCKMNGIETYMDHGKIEILFNDFINLKPVIGGSRDILDTLAQDIIDDYNNLLNGTTLDKIIITCCEFDVSSMIIISRILSESKAKKLHLFIHDNNHLPNPELFKHLVLHNTNVKNIKLHYMDVVYFNDGDKMTCNFDFMKNSTQIKTLSLGHNTLNKLKSNDNRVLFDLMIPILITITNLRVLKLNDIRIDESVFRNLQIISESCKNIKRIVFNACIIKIRSDNESISTFKSFKNLEYLSIISCVILNTFHSINNIVNDLSELVNLRKLKIINSIDGNMNNNIPYSSILDNFHIHDPNNENIFKITDHAYINFRKLTNLTSIDVSNNKLSGSCDLFSLDILICLGSNLRKINLSDCGLKYNDIMNLSYALQKGNSLKFINIKSNKASKIDVLQLFLNSKNKLSLESFILSTTDRVLNVRYYNLFHHIYSQECTSPFVMMMLILKYFLKNTIPKVIRFYIFEFFYRLYKI